MVDIAYQPISKVWEQAKLVHIKAIKKVSSGQVVSIDSEGVEKMLEADGIIVATGSVQLSSLMKDSLGKSKEERKAQSTIFLKL